VGSQEAHSLLGRGVLLERELRSHKEVRNETDEISYRESHHLYHPLFQQQINSIMNRNSHNTNNAEAYGLTK
jgi:DNA segregation ATPase FtsK/SpoIIIE-like protein